MLRAVASPLPPHLTARPPSSPIGAALIQARALRRLPPPRLHATMRGDRAARDSRHNKDYDNLKSSLKKGNKSKKHRVVFDESANEFFEADYIIVVRDECGYSDEGESEECSGCGACDRYQEPEPGALSPPEGYKDMGLFNRDGTLREQAWWEAGDVVLVGERSGTVFTPQHLQLLRRLQRERMLRSNMCADCDAHATFHSPHGFTEIEYNYDEEEQSDGDRELRPIGRRTAKHIAAGEERPKSNSSQQTTPTDECPADLYPEEKNKAVVSAPVTSEESDVEGRLSSEDSPLMQRRGGRGGILKGGRLWKSLDGDMDQSEDQRSTTASDEDGSVTPRSVRFIERPKDPGLEHAYSDSEATSHRNVTRTETPLVPSALQHQQPKMNSAVQQLFNSGRPPPPTVEPQLVTSETLRAWDAGVGARPRPEEAAVRRVAERNALRCSLLRSEARKRQQPKQDTIPLAERIRLLTCDMEDEEEQRTSPAGASSVEKFSSSSEKSYSSDKNSEKAFGSASSSSSSSTISVPVPTRQAPDLGDQEHKARSESRRLLSTLAPLTACVGNTAHHEGFYYVPPGDRASAASSVTNIDLQDHNETTAPDVVAGTPGNLYSQDDQLTSANEGDDGLAAFARAAAPRTDRIRQRYSQESQPVSSDDEHDDYGFQRRPTVRGIAASQQLGASDDILQQMQNELQPQQASVLAGSVPAHSCQRATFDYNYVPSHTETSHNSRPQSRASTHSSWSNKNDNYSTARTCVAAAHSESCYAHAQSVAYAQYAQMRQPDYGNCTVYANVVCSDSSQELYSSQTSSEQASPVRPARELSRRPESPPPIRSHHELLYLPYADHYHYSADYVQHWSVADYTQMQLYQQQQHHHHHHMHQNQQIQQQQIQQQQIQQQQIQQQQIQQQQIQQQRSSGSGSATPQPIPAQAHRAAQPQYSHAFQMQTLCPAPARYRTVPAAQPGGGKQMISFSEKVAAPLYQPAPGSPSRAVRGAPEGAPATSSVPTATSPIAPPPNPVYYAMNV